MQPSELAERNPSDAQRQRLERFMSELLALCGRHELAVTELSDQTVIYDMKSRSVVGQGIHAFTDQGHIKGVTAGMSIIDSAWAKWLTDGTDI